MSLARILILAGAALAAIFAAVLVNNAGSNRAPVEKAEATGPSVLVAAKPIAVGQKISPEDLAWRAWPADGVGAGMVTKETDPQAMETTAGAFARTDIPAGSPLFANQYVKAGVSHFMAAVLKPGARAASVPISDESASGGFILPNDRVDVVLTKEVDVQMPSTAGGTQTVKKVISSTVLQNVRVLAVDQTYKDAKEGEALKGATATLELWPRQVETLEKAKKQGEVALTLRSVGDGPAESGGSGSMVASASDGDEAQHAAIRVHGFSYSSEAMTEQ
ncbi:MAG: Flp pilus assembly protein CpaB [Caulobacterales bacterium]